MATGEHPGGRLDYTLEARRRRTIAIQVTREGRVRVLAPRRMPRGAVDAFVTRKRPWIEAKLAEFASLPSCAPVALEQGAALPYLGGALTLRLEAGRGAAEADGAGALVVPVRSDTTAAGIHRKVNDWYLAESRGLCRQIAADLAPAARSLGIPPVRGVESRRMRRRWGSCLPDHRIILNSELLGAPRECIAYVVAHELCHLREANHSPRFYALMERLVPRWRELRGRLNREAPLGFLSPRPAGLPVAVGEPGDGEPG